jgi:hypothetical protein
MKHGLKLEKENWTELLRTEYLRTTSCSRCTGLLVSDWFYDFENPAEYHAKVLRCVQCGHRVDPTIVKNRIRPPVVHDRQERFKDQHSMTSEDWEDAAVSY